MCKMYQTIYNNNGIIQISLIAFILLYVLNELPIKFLTDEKCFI